MVNFTQPGKLLCTWVSRGIYVSKPICRTWKNSEREQLQGKVSTKHGGMSTSLTTGPCGDEKRDSKVQWISSRDMADQHPANPVSQVSCAHLSILSLTLCNLSFRARDPIGSALHIGDALVRKEKQVKTIRGSMDGFQMGEDVCKPWANMVCVQKMEVIL